MIGVEPGTIPDRVSDAAPGQENVEPSTGHAIGAAEHIGA